MTDKDKKLAEQVLIKKGFFVMTHKEGSEHVRKVFIDPVIEAMQEYAELWHTAKMQEVMDEKLSAADEKWIIEIIEKTNAFAKQLIKDHFNRHKVYSRPECPFQYCDNPEDCKKQNKCHYSDGEIKHKEG